MKRFIRLLSMFLVIIMVVGMLPLSVIAENIQNVYTVQFKLSYNGAHTIPSQKVADGECAVQPENVTREGWIFKYWYMRTGHGTQKFDLSQPITEDITLYAHWDEDTEYWAPIWNRNILNGIANSNKYEDGDTYTVTFDANGSDVENLPAPQQVKKGECATEPVKPMRDRYVFEGWYTSANGGSKFDFDTKITGDITLYAHWNSNGFHHVHTYESFVTMATCTTDGYTIYKCSGCDDEYVDDFVECNGHTWDDWSVTAPATCYTFGMQTRYCTVCGESDTSILQQLTHDYVEDGTSIIDNTVFTIYRCINCHHTELAEDSEKPSVDTQDFVYDCDTDFSFKVRFDGSDSELRNRITIVETQAEGTMYDKPGLAQVTYILTKQDNNSWLVTPDGSYENGARYAARLSDDSVSFVDYQGNRLNFVIKRTENQTVIRINNDILYLKALENETPGYYPYKATEPNENGTIYLTVGRADGLKVEDLLCVGDYLNYNEIIAQIFRDVKQVFHILRKTGTPAWGVPAGQSISVVQWSAW